MNIKLFSTIALIPASVAVGFLYDAQHKTSQLDEAATVRVVAGQVKSHDVGTSKLLPSPPQITEATEAPPLDMSGDPERTRRSLAAEPRDLAWAPRAEQTIKAAFSTSGWTSPVTVECRSSGCEINGELAGIGSSNLRSVIARLTGPDINANLRQIGLKPDEHPVYTVVSEKPLRLSFSRIVARATGV